MSEPGALSFLRAKAEEDEVELAAEPGMLHFPGLLALYEDWQRGRNWCRSTSPPPRGRPDRRGTAAPQAPQPPEKFGRT